MAVSQQPGEGMALTFHWPHLFATYEQHVQQRQQRLVSQVAKGAAGTCGWFLRLCEKTGPRGSARLPGRNGHEGDK